MVRHILDRRCLLAADNQQSSGMSTLYAKLIDRKGPKIIDHEH